MQSEYFDYCNHCDGRGFINDKEYTPCPKCNWEPKKLNDKGNELLELLQDLKIHIELPSEWR